MTEKTKEKYNDIFKHVNTFNHNDKDALVYHIMIREH